MQGCRLVSRLILPVACCRVEDEEKLERHQLYESKRLAKAMLSYLRRNNDLVSSHCFSTVVAAPEGAHTADGRQASEDKRFLCTNAARMHCTPIVKSAPPGDLPPDCAVQKHFRFLLVEQVAPLFDLLDVFTVRTRVDFAFLAHLPEDHHRRDLQPAGPPPGTPFSRRCPLIEGGHESAPCTFCVQGLPGQPAVRAALMGGWRC